jgi:hypothetical protein
MIPKHDVVSDSKLAEWQVDISGKAQHVTLVQQITMSDGTWTINLHRIELATRWRVIDVR